MDINPLDRAGRASLSANAGEPRNAINRDALIDAIAQGLHGTWHCTRVWEAWHVGTMSQDDFEPVDESETPTEIADAVLALLAAPPTAQAEGWRDIATAESVPAVMSGDELVRLGKSPESGLYPWGIGTTRADYLRAVRAVLAAARAPAESVGRDADRYRWLRHGDNDEKVLCNGPVAKDYWYLPRNEKLDAAIDSAMAANGGNK